MFGDFKQLIVWQKSMDLVEMIYRITESFPSKEIYGLSSQMRRAAVSIPSNIAEGRRRRTTQDYKHFLHIAYGSAAEIETQIEIAKRLGYIDVKMTEKAQELVTEVCKILHKLVD